MGFMAKLHGKGGGERMAQTIDLKKIDERIQLIKKTAEELKAMAQEFPALEKNTNRILASIKMLEINISDVVDSGVKD